MRVRGVMTAAIVFLGILVLVPATYSQAPDERPVTEQGQAPPKEEKSRPKEFGRVFCAQRSTAQRFFRVDQVDCNDVCDNVYQEYPCELQQRLNEGWKVTSVALTEMVVERDPCECRLTGTESVLERAEGKNPPR